MFAHKMTKDRYRIGKRKKITTKFFIFIVFLMLFSSSVFGLPVFASSTDGTIDSTYKYAWGENAGWVNFGCDNCNVQVTDSGLSGYALSENIGWIYLGDITNNDGDGTLSGYAWSENTGWIKFNPTNGGVIIDSSGEFTGSALGENIGWIIFGGDYKVKTDWRPRSARPACNNSSDDDGDGKIDYPADPGCSSLEDTDETDPAAASSGGGGVSGYYPPSSKVKSPAEKLVIEIPEVIKKISEIIKKIPEIIKPKSPEAKSPEGPIEKLVSKEVPLAFRGKWQLLPPEPIREFVLAPLPKAIRNLAQKFPELEKTFEEVGVSKITDVAKLKSARLTLPGLTQRVDLPQGVPVAKLSPAMKRQVPTEIVFAKTAGGLIDFNIALSVSDKGEPQQKIQTVAGKPLQLVVKPDKPVASVKGYVVFKSRASQPTSLELPRDSLLASVIFASPVFTKTQEQPIRVEEKLVLLEFEYTDSNGDGIYTAEIQVPVVEGEYEIITVMDFDDPELGKKEIRLTTVVDPEGYIYERDGAKETRIPGAITSLYWLNPETKQYEMWPAKKYQQENPQTTDVRGTYSFLVPEGYYYLKAETPGYLVYDGKPFQVKEGSGVHINIELKTKHWWLKIADWKTILLAVVIILLLYNFYRDKIRERLVRSKNL
jgi:hypothetical protein